MTETPLTDAHGAPSDERASSPALSRRCAVLLAALSVLSASPPGRSEGAAVSWLPANQATCADGTGNGAAPGAVLGWEDLPKLQALLPEEVFSRRDIFFFEGMRLEVGPCQRDYGPAQPFREATRDQSARLDDAGRLFGYRTGLPFPAASIDADDPNAGAKWAWNALYRPARGESAASVRVTAGAVVDPVRYRGRSWRIWRSARPQLFSELPDDAIWLAGGETALSGGRRLCRFEQIGFVDRPTELVLQSPEARRVLRATAGTPDGQLLACLTAEPVRIQLAGGAPAMYRWRVAEVRELIAPINARNAFYPEAEADFGPAGTSFASNRWERRQALRLDGEPKAADAASAGHPRFAWWLDLETLTPLYYVGWRHDGSIGAVAQFAGRWSEDNGGASGVGARVVDLVGASAWSWSGRALLAEFWDAGRAPLPDDLDRRLADRPPGRR